MSTPTKGKAKQRDPPPTLFLHPSPAASQASLPGILAPGSSVSSSQAHPTLQRTTSLLRQEVPTVSTSNDSRRPGPAGHTRTAGSLGGFNVPLNLRTSTSRATDRTDALWAEMQATLEEVELSASGGTRVFGLDYDKKLSGLRHAQIALAQAWAKSEADDAIATVHPGEGNVKAGGAKEGEGKEGVSTAGSARPGSSGMGGMPEDETEVDILLARRRREANDRYFQRVNQGVLDVVAKLEDVAVAMRAVEQESKDIWGESESVPGSAKP